MEDLDLSIAFEDGVTAPVQEGEVKLATHRVAKIILTTGRVVACDALIPEEEPFTQPLPPAEYPVILSVATFADKDQRVAFAGIRVRDAEVVAWELALRAGEDPSKLELGQIYAFPVDSGTACFMDVEAAKALARRLQHGKRSADELIAELQKHYVNTWDWAEIRPDAKVKANAVLFSAGYGDGDYASYFGRDARGNVACLVTDFNIVSGL